MNHQPINLTRPIDETYSVQELLQVCFSAVPPLDIGADGHVCRATDTPDYPTVAAFRAHVRQAVDFRNSQCAERDSRAKAVRSMSVEKLADRCEVTVFCARQWQKEPTSIPDRYAENINQIVNEANYEQK